MPHVSRHSQIVRSGVHTNIDRKTTANADLPRDDINQAFAGDENESPGHGASHSTNVKSRRTEKSKGRTPIR